MSWTSKWNFWTMSLRIKGAIAMADTVHGEKVPVEVKNKRKRRQKKKQVEEQQEEAETVSTP